MVSLCSNAQVTLDPVFATQNDVVTITYNAAQGNGDLTGIIPVYMHTGVILEGENGWQNVQGNWGTADPNVLMTPIGNNIHQKTIDIADFYNLQPGDVVLQLSFVFRNAGGTIVGRAADGSDIFVDLYGSEFSGAVTSPSSVELLTNTPTNYPFEAQTNAAAEITLYLNDDVLANQGGVTALGTGVDFTGQPLGQYWLWMEADNGSETIYDSTYVILQGAPLVQNPPNGIIDGINYIDDNTVILQIFAPFKDFVYVLGDFNDGPGLDEYERLFSRSSVEIVIGMEGEPQLIQLYNERYIEALGRLKNMAEGLDRQDQYRYGSLRQAVS